MRIILERHAYAPELNKAYVGKSLVCVPAPGFKNYHNLPGCRHVVKTQLIG